MDMPVYARTFSRSFKQTLNQVLSTLENMRYTHDFRTARKLTRRYKRELKLPRVEFDIAGNTVRSKSVGVSLGLEAHAQFVPELGCIEELVNRAQAKVDTSMPGKLQVEIKGVQFLMETAQEVLVLHEIFVGGTYNFKLPLSLADKPVIVFDIGMNVGIASLFFASRREVERVYSFEPFRGTFDLAVRNIALNPALSAKVVPHDFGLADKDGEIEVEYSMVCNANNSIFGLSSGLRPNAQLSPTRQAITLRNASTTLGEILSREKGKAIVFKIDCEGAEYPIFELLEASGLLAQIHIMMIEWHVKGPSVLEERLARAGFVVFSLDPLSASCGMLYAARPCAS